MAESPLKNAKNAQRIVKIIKQLKIKAGRTGSFLISLCEIKTVVVINSLYEFITSNNISIFL